jgi:hypothetical protein
MATIQTINLPNFLPELGEQLARVLPPNHDSLLAILGLARAYLREMHPRKTSNKATRASTHILNLFYNDPFTQSIMPKATPVAHPATKELSALQIQLMSLENTLANIAKASAEATKVMKKSPSSPTLPMQNPAKNP